MNYEEIQTDNTIEEETKPKKVFTNFLRRKNQKIIEKSVNATEAIKEKLEDPEPIWEVTNENQEETMQDERKFDGKPKEFLKRKSRTIKPKKIQWKVERKIDCWVSKDIYVKKTAQQINEKEKESLTIEELEEIFENVLNEYVDTATYLKKFERIAGKPKIPHFKNFSDFLYVHNEEGYYETLEQLESHYLQLCNQGLKL